MSTTDITRSADGPRIAVIGLGNPIMGDDGFGIEVLDRLRSGWHCDSSVTLVDGGTWGLSLLPIIECAGHVLLLDAIRAGRAPGTLVTFEDDDVPRCFATKLSPHQIDVREVLALAQLRGALPRAGALVAMGVEPEFVDLRHGLSPVVQAQLASVTRRAVKRMRQWGASVSRAPSEAWQAREAWKPWEALCTR
ncbi:MAG TPA: HyaD/HybD family hydrogenase maturation endopeptidase [Gemmatimonadaceae bacterium]|nr:HyaD/HybD family hydrogenase maturation endopeptidase [Gemmatimonadaceae bacterium]